MMILRCGIIKTVDLYATINADIIATAAETE